MGEVIDLDIPTKGDIPPEKILQSAVEQNLQEVVIAGLTQDGDLYFATSSGYGPDILWLLESAKKRLFETATEEE